MKDLEKQGQADFARTQMKKEAVLQKLKECGGRITRQRRLLLDIIMEENCSCCKEIYYKAARTDPSIGAATVYRMVNTLEEIGAISKNHIYEIRYESDLREEKAEGTRAHLGQSMEDYLKTIYVIQRQKTGVRNVQIAEMMGRSKPSVTVAVNALVEKGYVKKKAHGNLCLTPKGMALADKIFDRHVFFQEILREAGVEEGQAEKEACMMEHILCDDSYHKLKKYIGTKRTGGCPKSHERT